MTEPLPEFAHQWMEQWRRAAIELPKIRAAELRQLGPAEALSAAALLDLPPGGECNPYENGLVIQQRWFMRQRLLELTAKELSNDGDTEASSIGS